MARSSTTKSSDHHGQSHRTGRFGRTSDSLSISALARFRRDEVSGARTNQSQRGQEAKSLGFVEWLQGYKDAIMWRLSQVGWRPSPHIATSNKKLLVMKGFVD